MHTSITRHQLHILILAGGGGTRLWPISRVDRPKFFLDIGTGEPLLLDAVRRALAITSPDHIHIVTSVEYLEPTRAITAPLGVTSLVCEPEARDTCAAIALSAYIIGRQAPDAVLVSMPADQVIPNDQSWQEAITALAGAADDHLACLGVMPTRPDTGFGYMHVPQAPIRIGLPCAVSSFHEKPDTTTATSYLAGRQHLWNSGIMAWRPDVFDELVNRHAPAVAAAVRHVGASELAGAEVLHAWRQSPRAPIEPVLLAPAATSGRLVAIPTEVDWNDLGSWTAVADLAITRDAQAERVLAYEANNCSVTTVNQNGTHRYVLVGVRDLVIVDCDDVVMIMHRSAAQDVKKVVGELKARDWSDLT